jgi:hypothetical protein
MIGVVRTSRILAVEYGWRVRAAAVNAQVGASACSNHSGEAEVARKVFAIVDKKFQECVFGAEIPPGEFVRTEVNTSAS